MPAIPGDGKVPGEGVILFYLFQAGFVEGEVGFAELVVGFVEWEGGVPGWNVEGRRASGGWRVEEGGGVGGLT